MAVRSSGLQRSPPFPTPQHLHIWSVTPNLQRPDCCHPLACGPLPPSPGRTCAHCISAAHCPLPLGLPTLTHEISALPVIQDTVPEIPLSHSTKTPRPPPPSCASSCLWCASRGCVLHLPPWAQAGTWTDGLGAGSREGANREDRFHNWEGERKEETQGSLTWS